MNIRFRSIKGRITLLVILSVIILTALLVGISYALSERTITDAYLNQLENFDQKVNRDLERFYQTNINRARFFAENGVIVEAIDTGEYGPAVDIMGSFFKKIGVFENIFLSTAERDSRIVADGIGGESVGLEWRSEAFEENIERALKGESHVSSPYKSPVSGKPVVLITAPIQKNGQVIGIFGLPIDLGTFSYELVKNIKIGKTGYPFITDSKGLTFAHPDKEQILKLNITEYEWGREMIKRESGAEIHYEWQGKKKIVTTYKNEKFGFMVGASIYLSDITDDVYYMSAVMTGAGGAGLILTALFVFFVVRRRLNPLDEFNDIFSAAALGDLTVRFDVTSVNCSEIMQCGKDSCPDYGRDGVLCWFDVGSYAPAFGKEVHCPKILSGEYKDCTECTVHMQVCTDEIYTLAAWFNKFIENMHDLIAQITVAADNLSIAVQEIASGNQNLSQRTSEQASSIEEIASTIEETTTISNQNADKAQTARGSSNEARTLADDGRDVMNQTVSSIGEINQSSEKIADIITMINDIAFQTNLLALNAAVEAARAGDSGRGFAVVAGEVRNLAQRSGSAAKEIEDLIKESREIVQRGTGLARKSGESLESILEGVRKVGEVIEDITASIEEQKQGMNQINTAILEMDTMTQNNATLVEETAATSEEMSNQAQEMIAMVARFKLDSGSTAIHQREQQKLISRRTGSSEESEKRTNESGNSPAGNDTTKTPERKGAGNLSELMEEDGFEEF